MAVIPFGRADIAEYLVEGARLETYRPAAAASAVAPCANLPCIDEKCEATVDRHERQGPKTEGRREPC